MNLFLASNNAHKAREFSDLLAGWRVAPASELGGMPAVEESADTFAGNAQLKVRALAERAAGGHWIIADDSGLCVDALDGAPGVRSARYAGPRAGDEENLWKLLRDLSGTPDPLRGARFVCTLVVRDPWGHETIFNGDCPGRISEEPGGGSGFGYDPIFIPDGYEESFSALGEGVKARISHRAEAVRKLRNWLEAR
jgi:XTP/dITP diphosphohydrolase